MTFHPDLCDRDETGMIGTVSGMITPESGMVGDSRQGTGSGGDCFRMFTTIGVTRCESLLDGSLWLKVVYNLLFS